MAGQEDVKDWKDALNRKVDYPKRDDLYKAIQRKMPKCYANFEKEMATSVADQQVLKLATYPEKAKEGQPPKWNKEQTEIKLQVGWEGFLKEHTFKVTKKDGGHGIEKRDIYVNHFDESVVYKALDEEPQARSRNSAHAGQPQGVRWTKVPKRPLVTVKGPVKGAKANLNRPKPGWRTFVMYDPDNFYEPRRLYYHHLSSQTFQQVNPHLLHPALFRLTPESMVTNPLPPNWRYVCPMGKPVIPEHLQKEVQLAPEGSRPLTKKEKDKKEELEKVRLTDLWTAMSSGDQGSCPIIQSGNVTVRRFENEYYFINSQYKTVSRYDPRTFEAKRALLKAFRQVNVQKNYQDMPVNTDDDKYLGSVYGNLASWSIAELHPNLEITNARGYRSLFVKLYGKEGGEVEREGLGVDLGGLTRALFSKTPTLWLTKALGLFETTFYQLMEINCIGAINFSEDAVNAAKKAAEEADKQGDTVSKEKIWRKVIDDPANWKYLKYYYVFGRFLGLAIFLNMQLGIHLGPTILGPLRGIWEIPWGHFHNIIDSHIKNSENPDYVGYQWDLYESVGRILQDPFKWRTDVSRAATDERDPHFIRQQISIAHQTSLTETNQIRSPLIQLTYWLSDLAEKDLNDAYPAVGDGESSRANRQFAVQRNRLHQMHRFMCQFAFERQAAAIANGVKDVIPLEWLRLFTEHELRLLIGGEGQFDGEDFVRNTTFHSQNDQQAAFFTRLRPALVAQINKDQAWARRLLQFGTSLLNPPVGGFAFLSPRFTFTIVANDLRGEKKAIRGDQILMAGTCGSRIDLPQVVMDPAQFPQTDDIFTWMDLFLSSEEAKKFQFG